MHAALMPQRNKKAVKNGIKKFFKLIKNNKNVSRQHLFKIEIVMSCVSVTMWLALGFIVLYFIGHFGS